MNPLKFFILADDDKDDAELFSDALKDVDNTVAFKHFDSCKKVVEYLSDEKNEKPWVLFLDINMPVMNGWECLECLKKDALNQHIPIIMYTTSSLSEDRERAMKMGAHSFITKPSSYSKLKNILEILAHKVESALEEALKDIEKLGK